MRLEAESPAPEVTLDVVDVPLDDGAAQREAEIAEAQAQELLVRELADIAGSAPRDAIVK
jgi:hypothetical protein